MPVEPRLAASCILLREGGEILMARRNTSLRFMAGHHVFPGGRIDDREGISHVTNARDEIHARAVQAVVREVFEETGLWCARGTLPDVAASRQSRLDLLENKVTFESLLVRFGLDIDAGEFELAGKWVTPSFSQVRFDTQYFLHRVRPDQREELIEGEIIGLDWFTPADARRLWHRGEIRISTPIAFTLQQLAVLGWPRALPWLMRGPGKVPGEHERYEIRHGITIVSLETKTIPPATHTNCVIVGLDQLYVIDPGAEDPAELEHLARQLDHLVELGGTVKAIVLTHSHPDHVAGAEFLRRRYGVPILAHQATAEQVSFPVDQLIADGDLLVSPGEIPWRLRAIHTPGHDPGHLCFLEESTGTLLAGDMLANPGTIVISEQYRGNMADYLRSLERLLEFPCKVLLPAHGVTMGQPHEKIREVIGHRLWREGKIRDAYAAGARTSDELLARAYDDVSPTVWPLARHSLEAHLTKLGITVDG